MTTWVAGAPKEAPRRTKVAAWLLTIVGLAVFTVLWSLDKRYAGGKHTSLLSGVGIAIIGIKAAVVAKWQH